MPAQTINLSLGVPLIARLNDLRSLGEAIQAFTWLLKYCTLPAASNRVYSSTFGLK